MNFPIFGLKFDRGGESEQDFQQQKAEPPDEESEVVAGCGQHGVDGVACAMGEMASAHAVLGLEMADDRFDGGA